MQAQHLGCLNSLWQSAKMLGENQLLHTVKSGSKETSKPLLWGITPAIGSLTTRVGAWGIKAWTFEHGAALRVGNIESGAVVGTSVACPFTCA